MIAQFAKVGINFKSYDELLNTLVNGIKSFSENELYKVFTASEKYLFNF